MIESSEYYDPPPQSPQGKCFQNTSDRNFWMAICCCRNFKKGSFDWKLSLKLQKELIRLGIERASAIFNSPK